LEQIKSLRQVRDFKVGEDRLTFSANGTEIATGLTSDLYFIRTREILQNLKLDNTPVVAEVFSRKAGILCGIEECRRLLQHLDVQVEALPEGAPIEGGEVVMRIRGSYGAFGILETALLGILASSSAWATAARECVDAAGDKPVICFGARHVHPAVAPVMERAAIIGGAQGASCILGAKLANLEPVGTVPHALFLIVGDTVTAAEAYHRLMPPDAPRTILVDTFKDEVEESLRVAEALGSNLDAIRLDTPAERGGVTPGLVREVRARLDQAGFSHVGIFVSGGLNPQRIRELVEAGADGLGVGSYISAASPMDMTLDIKEVNGKPIAKRGRIPGLVPSDRLKPLL
jgi:nicotinate phosphoribosyltransferase